MNIGANDIVDCSYIMDCIADGYCLPLIGAYLVASIGKSGKPLLLLIATTLKLRELGLARLQFARIGR